MEEDYIIRLSDKRSTVAELCVVTYLLGLKNLLNNGDNKSCRLATTCASSGQDIFACQGDGNDLGLHGGGLRKLELHDRPRQAWIKVK